MPNAYRERPTLSLSQLERIANGSHRIRCLGLDIECAFRPTGIHKPDGLSSGMNAQGYQILERIADMFWFLEHLEVNLEMKIADQGEFTNTRATLEGAGQMWKYLWQQMRCSRVRKSHEVTIPRLRSLDVVGGSYRPMSEILLYEAAAQQRFHIDISERDDDLLKGIATVTCVELKALQAKLGSCEPFRNHQQKVLMDAVTKRAEQGPFVRQVPSVLVDREMMRPSSFWDRLDDRCFYYR